MHIVHSSKKQVFLWAYKSLNSSQILGLCPFCHRPTQVNLRVLLTNGLKICHKQSVPAVGVFSAQFLGLQVRTISSLPCLPCPRIYQVVRHLKHCL